MLHFCASFEHLTRSVDIVDTSLQPGIRLYKVLRARPIASKGQEFSAAPVRVPTGIRCRRSGDGDRIPAAEHRAGYGGGKIGLMGVLEDAVLKKRAATRLALFPNTCWIGRLGRRARDAACRPLSPILQCIGWSRSRFQFRTPSHPSAPSVEASPNSRTALSASSWSVSSRQ